MLNSVATLISRMIVKIAGLHLGFHTKGGKQPFSNFRGDEICFERGHNVLLMLDHHMHFYVRVDVIKDNWYPFGDML